MALTDATMSSDVALNTDLYELTMAQGFWESGMREAEGCFTVFFRECPFEGGYAVACGIGQIADLVENFVFDEGSIDYLARVMAPGGGPMFKRGFLDYLRDFRMRVSVWAIPEGDLAFPREPMVRGEGPLIDCQLLETALPDACCHQDSARRSCRRGTPRLRLRSQARAGSRWWSLGGPRLLHRRRKLHLERSCR